MKEYLLRGEAERNAWSGYWWPMMSSSDRRDYRNLYDDDGPLDKYDQYCVACGLPNPRSREFEGWRHFADKRLEDALGLTAFWWGHCNGWAAAAVLENEPNGVRNIHGISFEVGDQKGLLTVCHNGDPVDVIRKIGENDAHLFHAMLIQSIGKEKRGLIFDTKLDPIDPETGEPTREVWNYPAYRYEFIYTQKGSDTWDVTASVWFADDAVEPNFIGTKNWPLGEGPKVYVYRISGDQERPSSGMWIGGSRQDHPDLMWRPQPLKVQNAAEARIPGSSQTTFHPTLRQLVYAICAGEEATVTRAIQETYRSLDLHWVVTEEEKASYPPPLSVGDYFRYSVTHKDTIGNWTRPFLLHVEVVGWDKNDWVFEVGAIHENEIIPERHVVYFDKQTRMLSEDSPFPNGYAYTLRQDIETGAFSRSDDPALWENSPLRRLLSEVPYAWDRAGMEPVKKREFRALGKEAVPGRSLSVSKGVQFWADHTVSHPQGNVRGMFLLAELDRISAQLVDFGHKNT
jgi:hypothetical protein